jgi:hypothetical protein
MKNSRLGALAASIALVVTGILLAACTFSLDPVNAVDTLISANNGVIRVTNDKDSGVPLSAVRVILPDETFTEYRFEPGLEPDTFKDYSLPAGVNYGVMFHNGRGWTVDAKSVSFSKGVTVPVVFDGTEAIQIDDGEKGTLTVSNRIPATNGEYVIKELRISSGEAGQETEVYLYETEIKPAQKYDFKVPAAAYWVRARIQNSAGTLSKWSVPALVEQGGILSTAPGEVTVSADLAGVAVFNDAVLLENGSVNTPLGEVSNLQVAQGSVVGKITLTWVDPDDEDVTKIAISCTDPVGGVTSKTVLKNVQTADITGLVDGQAYVIQVQTVDKSGNKSAGAFMPVVIGNNTPPAEVTNLIAAPGAGKIRLTWTDPADADFKQVEISYSANSGSIRTLPPVAKAKQQETISSLSYGTLYGFTVKTVDSSGNKSMGSVAIASLASVVTDLALDTYITAPLCVILCYPVFPCVYLLLCYCIIRN